MTHDIDVPHHGENDKHLSPGEVANFANIPLSTLRRLRRQGGGPPFVRITHKLVRYPLSEFQEWLSTRHTDYKEVA